MPYVPHPTCQIPVLRSLLEGTLGFRLRGTFVEVGAFDGETYSNTSFLADLGWRGVYVEPVPHFAAACAARHARNPNITVVQCAVGPDERTISLQLGGPLSTADAAMSKAYETITWAPALAQVQGRAIAPEGMENGGTVVVPQRRLEDILGDTGVPLGFDLLVVDVEGGEDGVFASFDLAFWRPKILIVELEDEHPAMAPFPEITDRARAVRDRIHAAGYKPLYRDTINTVFAAPP